MRLPRLWQQLVDQPRLCLENFLRDLMRGHLLDRAAQMAFWQLLGIFPGLISLFALFGSVVEERVGLRDDLFNYLGRLIPNEAVAEFVLTILDQIQLNRGGGKFPIGIIATLWIASTVLSQLHRVIDRHFGTRRRQTWFRRITAFPLSIVVMLPIVSAVLLLFYGELIGSALASRLGAETAFTFLVRIGHWPLILLSVVLCFDLVYNTAPSMWRRKSSWITPGALLALCLWLTVSLGFRYYVARFAMIADFYGSLTVVILLMVWLFLTSIAILVGIALNTEIHLVSESAAKTVGSDAASAERATVE